MDNKIRLIAGHWRSRQLHFMQTPHLRPTPARVRETLFNWLQTDIVGSRCLDLYAGSGALSFEAGSRGAGYVVQVENNPLACQALENNAQALQASQVKLVQADAFAYLAGRAEAFDIVFIDPPFTQALAARSCQSLEHKGWLADWAKIYVETPRPLLVNDLPDNWQLLKQKTAGEVVYSLYQRIAKSIA